MAGTAVRPPLFPLSEGPHVGEQAAPSFGAPAAEAEEKEGDEDADVICLRAPMRPTAQMIAEHEVCHLPFRAWCPYCVRARGASCGHPAVQKEDEQIPTLSCDYGFLGTPEQAATDLPTLVIKDRLSKTVWSHALPSKGVEHPHGSKCLLHALQETGYKRLILKSDQEPSIRALCRAASNAFDGEVIPEEAPKENHERSNGEAEASVKQVHGMARTFKEMIEHLAEVAIPPKHPILAWMVEHAGTVISLFSKGEPKDGLTPYQRLKGKPWRVALPALGERVEYRRRTRHKFEGRWRPGVFLGVKRTTTEKIIGDADGVYTVQSIRRVDQETRWDKDLLLSIRGTPWDPNPGAGTGSELPQPITMAPERPEVPVGGPQAFQREAAGPKRVYITRKNLEKFGYTAACPACDAQRAGTKTAGLQHTQACRSRLEDQLERDPVEHERVLRAQDRITEAIAKSLEERDAKRPRTEAPDSSSEHPDVSMGAGPSRSAPEEVGGGQSRNGADEPSRPQPEDEMDLDRDSRGTKRAPEIPIDDAAWEEQGDADARVSLLLQATREETIASIEKESQRTGDANPVCEEPQVMDQEVYAEKFFDDLTGRELDPGLVREARSSEIDFVQKMGVWREIDRPPKDSGITVLKARWVDINKGDEAVPVHRSRYVAKEIKKGARSALVADFFAAMPPLSSSKFLLNLAVTGIVPDADGVLRPTRSRGKGPLCVSFVDVKRAHFVSAATRRICVELPPECKKEGEDKVGLLLKSMYGTRDAAANWEREIRRALVDELGFTQGRATPCNFYHERRGLRVTVHGDDFETLGHLEDLQWFEGQLEKTWLIEKRGIFGPPGTSGTVQHMRHLNRLLTWDSQGICWESDPRHVDLILAEVHVTSSKVTTPLVKEKAQEAEEEDTYLDAEATSRYQSLAMRLNYIAQDRTDLQRTVRELAKGMQSPTERHWALLKRAARYLRYAPRVVQRLGYQDRIDKLEVYVDSDHAGCVRTRKSTTGAVIMLGKNQLRSLCRGQAVIALSSGEAEYYGLVTGTSEAIGEQSIALDWGIKLPIVIHMDATAGAAIGSRRGLGKVKHISTVFLWAQERVTTGQVKIRWTHTSVNLADILTKAIDASTLRNAMKQMNFTFPEGRSDKAYKTDGLG